MRSGKFRFLGSFSAGGTPPATSYRYWRVNITKSLSTDLYAASLATLELRDSLGGASIAAGGAAVASTEYTGQEAGNLFDSNLSTAWVCMVSSTLPQWAGYEFPSPVEIVQVLLTSANSSTRAKRAPEDFTVDYSEDGVTWTTAATFLGEPAWGISESRTYIL